MPCVEGWANKYKYLGIFPISATT